MAKIIVITGPSGVGKKEIISDLVASFDRLSYIPTLTTRKSRTLGDNMYEFVNEEEFFNLVENNSFLEYKTIGGHNYGTLIRQLDKTVNSDTLGIISVDIDGAVSIKSIYTDNVVVVFVAPPSTEHLQESLRRKNISAHEIHHRVNLYEGMKHQMHEADFTIVNVSRANTVKLIGQIIKNIE